MFASLRQYLFPDPLLQHSNANWWTPIEVEIQKQSLNVNADTSYEPVDFEGRRAPLSIDVLVVGCGLGGLAAAHCLAKAGHRVTIIEAASAIGEVGAGIQVSPNISRLLRRWGLGNKLEKLAVRPEGIQFMRYSTGERVGYTTWGDTMEQLYGAPYYHIHRADLHQLLYDITVSLPNVSLRLASKVVRVHAEGPSVTLASGEIIRGELLVGADGIKSVVQTAVLGTMNEARATGDAAYRAIVPTSVMMEDPELRVLVEHPTMTAWMAPGRHLMGYNIRSKQEYNLVLLHPDDGSVESWTAPGSADKMRADFFDFEPRVQRLLSHVKSTLKWRLMDRQPLHAWINPSGHIVLLGDACHPMLPYRAQGAAMAIEDGAVLGNLLSRLSEKWQIPLFLEAYQCLRLPRTADMQRSSGLNRRIFHLPDGEEQRQRDADMREAMYCDPWFMRQSDDMMESSCISSEGEKYDGNPNQWADQTKNQLLFGYDADEVADRWWLREGHRAMVSERVNVRYFFEKEKTVL